MTEMTMSQTASTQIPRSEHFGVPIVWVFLSNFDIRMSNF